MNRSDPEWFEDTQISDPSAKVIAMPTRDKKSDDVSDDALALEFASKHVDHLRWVNMWSRWMVFDGTVWRKDETLRAWDLVRVLCRGHGSRQAKTVAAVERMAHSDRFLAATVEQWDIDPDLLNTPSGMIDLKSGSRCAHDPQRYCTKITAVAPEGKCPLWLQFLSEVTDDDPELILYLQRLCGYGLTGNTREHALFFLYGTGANGKSVFLNTVSGIVGGYHRTAPIETFTATHTDRHPTELAMLQGARLVTAIETEEGRAWAESKIKSMTGGDSVSARFMRQDFFEFIPTFKLIVAGNHKPRLNAVDEAIRRRMNLIPFTVTIPQENRDPHLSEKLKAEWPGILHWMIEGCLIWQEQGLNPPAVVRNATAEYLASEDAFEQWLEDCCQEQEFGFEKNSDLFQNWQGWASAHGEESGTQKRLVDKLETRFARKRQPGTGQRGFDGIRLIRKNYADDQHFGG